MGVFGRRVLAIGGKRYDAGEPVRKNRNQAQREYYARNRAVVIARNFQYRQDPAKKAHILAWYKSYRRKIRLEMIAAYGSKCSCCGEANESFLTLEHLNHDGQEHRKKHSGVGYLRDLKNRGWPIEGYTILCCNCNHATRLGAICPHKMELKIMEVV